MAVDTMTVNRGGFRVFEVDFLVEDREKKDVPVFRDEAARKDMGRSQMG